ncbi:MAG: YbgC/FadM family acyl-CoA thioesterase [Proteobacteria bacterium]|nr:YbgC/FadM family acyl-CoA thioesterase [Pseudomonadota bacterium]
MHEIKVKVYYEDTDAGGVVYYGNYLRYLERARTEFLADKGIDVVKYHHLGYFFVVVNVDINYKKPAKLGDIITITTEAIDVKNATITFLNRILKDNIVLVEAKVTIACMGLDGKPKRFPDEVKFALQS